MLIDDAPADLRADADLLLTVAEKLSGRSAERSDHWYKLSHKSGSGFAWLRLVGERARKYPANSIHLVVKPDQAHAHDERLEVGSDWWGKEDRHVVVEAGDRAALATAIELLARAFWLDDRNAEVDALRACRK